MSSASQPEPRAATPADPADPADPAIWPAGEAPTPEPGPGAQAVPMAPAAPTHDRPVSSYAVAALVLAIASWVICPLLPAIVALVLAQVASRDLSRSSDDGRSTAGDGLVLASRIVAWVNIGACAAVILVGGVAVLVVLLAAAASS